MTLQEIAQRFNRSPDAITHKVTRLGLEIPDAWFGKKKTTKSAFQVLSWIQGLLRGVKTVKDVDNVRAQVDLALDEVKKSAATDFQQGLRGK